MPTTERQKFFVILSTNAFRGDDDMTHEQLFGHLASDNFTAQEAAEISGGFNVNLPAVCRWR